MVTGRILLYSPAKQLLPDPEPEKLQYQVPLPGWDDVIHVIPESAYSREDQQLRKHVRAERLANSPVPDVVRRITSIMNWIDNIEDLVSTVLVAGRLARIPIPAGAIPYLGWVLTIRDLAEFAGAMTSLTGVARAGKRRGVDMLEHLNMKSGARLQRVERFKRSKPGLGALLEALQTSEWLTGVGLSLGPIMGAQQDILFGLYRHFHGSDVKVQLPKPTSLEGLAAYVLTFAPYAYMFAPAWPVSTVLLSLTAIFLSVGILTEGLAPTFSFTRWEEAREMHMLKAIPTNPFTCTALDHLGIDPARDEPPPWPYQDWPITLGEWSDVSLGYWQQGALRIREILGHTYEGTFTSMIARETGRMFWDWYEGTPRNMQFSPNMYDLLVMRMIENSMVFDRRLYSAPPA